MARPMENDPLLGSVNTDETIHENQPSYATSAFKIVAAVAVFSGALIVAGSMVTSSTSQGMSLSTDQFKVEVSNGYSDGAGQEYRWLAGKKLVEPHKSTQLSFAGITADDDSLTTYCKATHVDSNVQMDTTSCDNMLFTKVGDYTIEIVVQSSEGSKVSTYTTDVTCRYVRRDIRKLTESDKTKFFDAIQILFDLSRSEGREIYGNEFKDMSYFIEKHLDAAIPDKHHDYLHDGMGFLSQHIALTNEYESAVQMVDPACSLPYWDFTQDFEKIRKMAEAEARAVDYSDLWSLDIWAPEFFGKADSSLHTVTEGRWAYTRVPQNNKTKDNANPYGFLRAPWNLQVSPYVTRYHEECSMSFGGKDAYLGNAWPSCALHHHAVEKIDALAQYMPYMSYSAHGGVHTMIGGSGEKDCEAWSELIELVGHENVKYFKSRSTIFNRNVWRYGLCEAPRSEDCIGTGYEAEGSDSCRMQCTGCENDSFSEEEIANYLAFVFPDYTPSSAAEVQTVFKIIFCDSKVVTGEHIEGSSPVDVSFWTIHPTLERLTVYKQMVNPFTNVIWDASKYETDWTDLCKWGYYFDGVSCTGHGKTDKTISGMVIYDEAIGDYVTKHLTNYDIIKLTKPEYNHLLPYIYADFDYSHCEAGGVTFKKIPKNDHLSETDDISVQFDMKSFSDLLLED